MIRFRVPYPVSLNRAYRNFRGRMVMSADGRAYKMAVERAAKAVDATKLSGDARARYTLHPRLTARGKASKTRLDLGNVEKLLSDALNGLIWDDDKQIVDLHVVLGDPLTDGGVTVEVEAA